MSKSSAARCEEHLEIFDLIARRQEEAGDAARLSSMCARALDPNVERLKSLRPLSDAQRPPFLIPADRGD